MNSLSGNFHDWSDALTSAFRSIFPSWTIFNAAIAQGTSAAELARTIPYYTFRLAVPPGLTGWAQVNMPSAVSDEEHRRKLEYDLYYVKNHTLLFDLVIMLQTAEVVLWGKGR